MIVPVASCPPFGPHTVGRLWGTGQTATMHSKPNGLTTRPCRLRNGFGGDGQSITLGGLDVEVAPVLRQEALQSDESLPWPELLSFT